MTNTEILNALNAIQAQIDAIRNALGAGGSSEDGGFDSVVEVSAHGGVKMSNVEAYKKSLTPAVAAKIPTYFLCEELLVFKDLEAGAEYTLKNNCNRALFTLVGESKKTNWIEACEFSRSFWGSPIQGALLPDHGVVCGSNGSDFAGVKLSEILGIVKIQAANIARDLNQPQFPWVPGEK